MKKRLKTFQFDPIMSQMPSFLTLGQFKPYSVDKDIRKEYVQMMQSGKYTIAYLAKMAKVSRQTLYNWKADLQ